MKIRGKVLRRRNMSKRWKENNNTWSSSPRWRDVTNRNPFPFKNAWWGQFAVLNAIVFLDERSEIREHWSQDDDTSWEAIDESQLFYLNPKVRILPGIVASIGCHFLMESWKRSANICVSTMLIHFDSKKSVPNGYMACNRHFQIMNKLHYISYSEWQVLYVLLWWSP